MNLQKERTVGFQLRCVSQQIRKELDRSSCAIQTLNKVTGTHGWVIGYLHENQGKDIFQKDLEKVLSIQRSTATAMLQLMEKNGLIHREAVPYDARLKKIVLTQKALEIQEAVARDIAGVEERLVDGIPEQDLATFYSVLEKMKENLGEHCD